MGEAGYLVGEGEDLRLESQQSLGSHRTQAKGAAVCSFCSPLYTLIVESPCSTQTV